jgi:hypothetical protein
MNTIAKYPWVSNFVDMGNVSKIEESREYDGLGKLSKITHDELSKFIWGEPFEWREIYLINANGERIAEVGEIPRPAPRPRWWNKNPQPWIQYNPRETITEAMERLGQQKDEVAFFLIIFRGKVTVYTRRQ